MGETTGIAWTDSTFNPWMGCTKVSEACRSCYAETETKRWGKALWGPNAPRQVTSDANWKKPLQWNKAAEKEGKRRRVFCASLADVFEERRDLEGPRERLHQLVAKTPWLDWLLLTKRPDAVGRVPGGLELVARENVWLGTTVESQERAEERLPHLLASPARVRFLSCEPLLGPLTLLRWLAPFQDLNPDLSKAPRVSWVIVGGESGHNARPMHPSWARSLRDQCQAAGVPFFFKQWGEWRPWLGCEDDPCPCGLGHRSEEGFCERVKVWDVTGGGPAGYEPRELLASVRVGKKAAGNLLDGQLHEAFPDAVATGARR